MRIVFRAGTWCNDKYARDGVTAALLGHRLTTDCYADRLG